MAQLYDCYGRLVYALILRIVNNQAAAEDLVEETFLRVWNRAQSCNARKIAVGPWLLSVARNRAIEYLHFQEGRGSRPPLFEQNEDPRFYAGPEAGVLSPEQARRIRQALGQLPENQRQAIELFYFGGLSPTQVAAKLGQPAGTLKTWVRDGLASLRRTLAPGVRE